MGMGNRLMAILILTFVFYCTFVARIIFGPLLPVVAGDLHLTHAASGAIFFWVSCGLFVSSILSGFLSYLIPLRYLVYGASYGVGITLLNGLLLKGITHIYVFSAFIGFFAGLYLSAGIAIITSTVEKPNWGKAISIHELAPNLSFVSAPFIAEVLVRFMSWRMALLVLGLGSITSGVLFSIYGKGGEKRAQGNAGTSLLGIAVRRDFWTMAFLFGLGVGSAMGVFSMLPLFLVMEKGFAYKEANYLVGFSRMFAVAAAFLSGFLADRVGYKRVIMTVLLLSSLCAVGLALAGKELVHIFVILQPFFAQAFFPAGFSALSHMTRQDERAMIVGLTVPIAVLMGAGGLPWLVGFLGDKSSLSVGLVIVAVIVGLGSLLTQAIRESRSQ